MSNVRISFIEAHVTTLKIPLHNVLDTPISNYCAEHRFLGLLYLLVWGIRRAQRSVVHTYVVHKDPKPRHFQSRLQVPSATVSEVLVRKNTSYGVLNPNLFLGR